MKIETRINRMSRDSLIELKKDNGADIKFLKEQNSDVEKINLYIEKNKEIDIELIRRWELTNKSI